MISEYNNLICPKIIDYIKFFLERIESSSDNVKVELAKYVVIDTNNFDINYLITHGLTGTFTLKCYFKVNNKGSETEFVEDLEIPKMISNIFVIEGAMRIPTNTLDNDNTMTIYSANIRINDLVNISYEEDPHQPDGYLLTIKIYEDEEEPIIIEGNKDNFNKYQKYFKLTEEEQDKLKVKLDTDDIQEYLSYDNVIQMINLGPDKAHDNMIDKKIYTPEANLMNYLWSRDIRKKVQTNMKTKFYQFNHIYLKDIQNAIMRYFIISSEKNISIPTTVNPLIFDAMRYKIMIPENVAYNKTMSDIIDIVNTPVHNNNVNKQNELNVCAEIRDDGIYIKCYTYPDQTPVTVKYSHYCTKKVLLNQYWDYDKKTFKDNVKSVNYKLRLKLKVGSPTDKFDYIEPKADDMLSLTTRRVPLGNVSDSVRLGMATSMMKQALELHGSEPPLVTAGHDNEDFELSVLITRFKGNQSKVEKIKDNKIYLKDIKTGSVQFIEIPSPTPSADDSIISFDAVVKPGQIVSDGEVLVVPRMLKNRSFELGLNANAVYLNYLGYTHEDGFVISESLSNRMIHYSILNVSQEIYTDDIIKYMKKIGSRVKSKDILVNNQTRLKVNQALKDTFGGGGLLSGMGISFNQNNLVVPNNIDEGYVIDARIEIHPERPLSNEATMKLINDFKKEEQSHDWDGIIPDKYRELHANDVELSDRASGTISYKIIRVDRCKIGDKATNRYGGKGILSLVLPDKCMPQIVHADGTRTPVEIVLNPGGVLHRKNISQLYECAISKCIIEIYKKVSSYVQSNDIASAKKFLSTFDIVYEGKFSKMSDAEFIDHHTTKGLYGYAMSVGFYTKINFDILSKWMNLLGVKETDKIFLPDVVIVETKQGLKGFAPEDYVQQEGENPKRYELGYCDQPCITGTEYMMKLWKQANYDGKVTAEVLDTEEPVMGRGMYRGAGQKIGEMELWVLIGSGIEKFIQDQSETMKTSQYQFLNELLLSGYYIQDAQGSPILSNSRARAQQLAELK